MASVASPRSPAMSQALNSPLDFLPVTRFPTMDERLDTLHEVMVEAQKERDVIQAQPYRTTPLICPNPKPRPDLVNNKLTGKALKPTVYRPVDQRSVVANLSENQAIVNRQQYNNPRPLYSDQNIQEAIYVQTGVNYPQQQPQQQQLYQQQPLLQQPIQQQPLMQQPRQVQQQQRPVQQQRPLQQRQQPQVVSSHLGPPEHRTPDTLPEFNAQKSPTYRAILEEEGPGTLQPAAYIQKAPPQRIAHNTAPTYNLNSVGMPNDRIAQSGSFKRLMWSVMQDA